MPKPVLSPEAALLLAEIDSGAELHPGGGLTMLSQGEWLAKWQAFRKAHPDYSGHALE